MSIDWVSSRPACTTILTGFGCGGNSWRAGLGVGHGLRRGHDGCIGIGRQKLHRGLAGKKAQRRISAVGSVDLLGRLFEKLPEFLAVKAKAVSAILAALAICSLGIHAPNPKAVDRLKAEGWRLPQ